uniref:Uncharacterized protein n=1 Tax=viral metagenome TaxID=1070528 RepID=A0A6C0JMK9_9ZZZZ
MSDYLLLNILEQIYSKRIRCEYTLLEQEVMKLRKQNVLNELEILKLTGVSVIYENQEIIAYKVISAFKNRKIINIMVVSKTQSGKTGSMCATIKKYLEDTSNIIPIENIYIITGLSSCEWKEQTKERLPASVQSRVFHRCDLPSTFVDEIKNKKNILIIMDEIQVAAKKGQTIFKSFQAAGLLDKQKLYEKDVKILEYTATPDGTIYDLMKWNDASTRILAEVGDGYVSAFDLLQQGRVKQYKDICGYDKETGNIEEHALNNIKLIKMDVDNYAEPKWHIVRTKNGAFQDKTLENFIKIFGNTNYEFIKYDRESDIEDINKTIRIRPNKHTIILIKEMLRCAKTLVKDFLGVSYERYSKNPDDASIIQGLVGRNTGYDDNGISICYTNVDSIERYEKLWESNFEDKTIRWKSKTTKYRNGILYGKNTFNDPNDYDGFSVDSDDSDDIKEPLIKKFKSQDEAKKYFNSDMKTKLGGRGPNKIKPNDNGFYEATIRSNKKIYSCEEIRTERKQGLTDSNYRFYPCYKDTEDINTLEWWLIHY